MQNNFACWSTKDNWMIIDNRTPIKIASDMWFDQMFITWFDQMFFMWFDQMFFMWFDQINIWQSTSKNISACWNTKDSVVSGISKAKCEPSWVRAKRNCYPIMG